MHRPITSPAGVLAGTSGKQSFSRISATRLRALTAPRKAVLAATAGLALAMPVAASVPADASVTVTSHFVWTADSSNTSGDSAYIANGATNNRPGDLLFVTPNYNAAGLCGCAYEPDAIGVWYDSSHREWAAFREDGETMPAGESFNVLVVPRASRSVFVQKAKPSNTAGDFTLINSPLTNRKPRAMIQVTQDWNPGGSGGAFNRHPVGVWYDSAKKKWAIFNEDRATMHTGVSFNVLVGQSPSNGGTSALLRTTRSNRADVDTTLVRNAETTGNPNNVTFVTQDWNPGGKGGVYDNVQTGVWYTGTREGVFSEDRSSPPLKSAFNLLIFSS